MAALEDCPVGAWMRITEFFRYILAGGYDLVVCRSLENLTIDGESGSYYDPNFKIVEARYIVCCLFEYLATLGIIDVSFLHPDDCVANFNNDGNNDYYIDNPLSSYDGLTYFRITPLGAYLLGISDRYIPKELPQTQILRILPNLEVVAVGELARADRPTAMMARAACYLVIPTETETKFRSALKKIGYSLPN